MEALEVAFVGRARLAPAVNGRAQLLQIPSCLLLVRLSLNSYEIKNRGIWWDR